MMGGSDYLCVGALDSVGAIVACDGDVLAVDDAETCAHGLVVGDALGIATLHQAVDGVGESDGKFLNHLVVTDDVDHGCGRDQGDAVEGSLGEEHVGHLYYTFVAKFLAVEVVADGHGRLHLLYTQDLDSLEQDLGGNMVDHSAVAQSSHGEFCFRYIGHKLIE